MTPACLVVGCPGVGKYTLIKSLQVAPEDKNSVSCSYKLRLDTKYYTADVLAQSVSTEYELSTACRVEALVLVFDVNQQSSFNDIRIWADRQDADSVEIKIVVGNKADLLPQASSSPDRPAWLADAISWCYDCGYEYIEAAAGHPEVDAKLQLDDEQQGVARLLSALQAHMWPGMVLKTWSPALPAATAAAGCSDYAASSRPGTDQNSTEAAAADADRAPRVAALTGELALETSALTQQQQQQAESAEDEQLHDGAIALGSSQPHACQSTPLEQPAQQQEPRLPGGNLKAASDEADTSCEDVEFDMDDFEKLMRQVQGMRTRLSGLADADRRAAAADMALKLASLMGLDDEGGSSDEEDVLQRDVQQS